MSHTVKPGSYDPSYSAYVERMAAELKEQRKNLPKHPISTAQPASTKALLEAQEKRAKEDDFLHWGRPIPSNWKAVPNAKTLDEAVGKKDFDASQVAVIEDIRRKARNTLGQSESSSVSEESKQRARDVWLYTPPAPYTKEEQRKIKELEDAKPKKELPKEVAPAKEMGPPDTILVGQTYLKNNWWNRLIARIVK
jgi:hypothetical protein